MGSNLYKQILLCDIINKRTYKLYEFSRRTDT